MDIFVIIIQDNQKWGKYFVKYTNKNGGDYKASAAVYYIITFCLPLSCKQDC